MVDRDAADGVQLHSRTKTENPLTVSRTVKGNDVTPCKLRRMAHGYTQEGKK